jgi:hypothetical protein
MEYGFVSLIKNFQQCLKFSQTDKEACDKIIRAAEYYSL